MKIPVHLPPVSPGTMPWTLRWLGGRDYWLCQAAGWGGYVLLFSLSLLAPNSASHRSEFIENASIALFGLLTTHLVRVVILYFRQKDFSGGKLALSLLLLWLVAGLAHGGTMCAVNVFWAYPSQLADGSLDLGDGWNAFLAMVSRSLIFMGGWIGLYLGYHYYRQYRAGAIDRLQLEAGMKEAELRALKAQLNPHFLFNSLNSIRALVPREFAAPRQAVTSLSELLRATLEFGRCERITLAQELTVVAHYLALEQMRHEARLQVEQTVEDAALGWAIPPFTVQTLVENAVNHGISQLTEGGVVGLRASVQAGRLIVQVTNPGQIRANERSTGLGLANARARLALLFGTEAGLTLEQVADNQVRAQLTVPRPSDNS